MNLRYKIGTLHDVQDRIENNLKLYGYDNDYPDIEDQSVDEWADNGYSMSDFI